MFNSKTAPIIPNMPVALLIFDDFYLGSFRNNLLVEGIGDNLSKCMFDFPVF